MRRVVGAAAASSAATAAGQTRGDHDRDHDNRRDAAADPQAAPVGSWTDRAAWPARHHRPHRSGRRARAVPRLAWLTVRAGLAWLSDAWLTVAALPASAWLARLPSVAAWLGRLAAVTAALPGCAAWLTGLAAARRPAIAAWLTGLSRLAVAAWLPCPNLSGTALPRPRRRRPAARVSAALARGLGGLLAWRITSARDRRDLSRHPLLTAVEAGTGAAA